MSAECIHLKTGSQDIWDIRDSMNDFVFAVGGTHSFLVWFL